jgi:ribosomal protein L7/L12
MDTAMVALLTLVLETVKVCVANGAYASDFTQLVKGIGEAVLSNVSDQAQTFSVRLVSYGDFKIQCIKAIRSNSVLGLKEAKELVESAPAVILETKEYHTALDLYHDLKEIRSLSLFNTDRHRPVVELLDKNGIVKRSQLL